MKALKHSLLLSTCSQCFSTSIPPHNSLISSSTSSFSTELLTRTLCGAVLNVVHLPIEDTCFKKEDLAYVPNILREEIDYISSLQTSHGKSEKRMFQYLGGRKALREAVHSIHPSIELLPAVFHDDYGAPKLPTDLSNALLCSISHKNAHAIAAAAINRNTIQKMALGDALYGFRGDIS